MAAIITAHIAQSRKTWPPSQWSVIIHALAPVIGPYMSRAIATIHDQQTIGTRIRRTRSDVRSCPSASSRHVGGRSLTEWSGTPPVERRKVAVVLPARVVPCLPTRVGVALRRVREREAARDRMA